jgi:hypothetical protein
LFLLINVSTVCTDAHSEDTESYEVEAFNCGWSKYSYLISFYIFVPFSRVALSVVLQVSGVHSHGQALMNAGTAFISVFLCSDFMAVIHGGFDIIFRQKLWKRCGFGCRWEPAAKITLRLTGCRRLVRHLVESHFELMARFLFTNMNITVLVVV